MPAWVGPLVKLAVDLWSIADEIIGTIKRIPGVDSREVDKVVAANRAKRAAQIATDRAKEWPDG